MSEAKREARVCVGVLKYARVATGYFPVGRGAAVPPPSLPLDSARSPADADAARPGRPSSR